MSQSTRVVNLYSKADLNALLGNSSGDWTDYLPPPSLERRVPLTKPICLTEDASKFHLDMSFNRDGIKRDHNNRRFTDAIGPKTLPPLVESPQPIPSDISDHDNCSEWRSHWRKWSFPLRTDSPRGLTWGPYYDRSDLSSKRLAEDDNNYSKETKRRKIFIILRLPKPPIMIKLKINPKFSTISSIKEDLESIEDQEILMKNSLSSFGKRDRSSLSESLIDNSLLLQNQSKRHCNSNIKLNSNNIENTKGNMNYQNVFATSHHLLNTSEPNNPKELVDIMISPSKKITTNKASIRICVASQLEYGL